ncbi:MAG TPA: hypothetical protein VKC51_10100 [Lacunisphaera sp.]|nr:hypothetical protein [Lacunisphaera sp.]
MAAAGATSAVFFAFAATELLRKCFGAFFVRCAEVNLRPQIGHEYVGLDFSVECRVKGKRRLGGRDQAYSRFAQFIHAGGVVDLI